MALFEVAKATDFKVNKTKEVELCLTYRVYMLYHGKN